MTAALAGWTGARWAAAAWLAVWAPTYAMFWGWKNFLALCDVAAVLTCVGIWRSSGLLLSSQALLALVISAMWIFDVGWRVLVGHHLIGGTEYMWDATRPLAVRLLSLYHLVLPVVLVAALRRTGYDRRALPLQTLITLGVLVVSRLVQPDKNLNYVYRDPFFGRVWGPAPVHIVMILAGAVVLVYLPTHLALARWVSPPRPQPTR